MRLPSLLASEPPKDRPWVAAPAHYWNSLTVATAELDAPVAALSLPALLHNIADLRRRAQGAPIRVASKSLRVRPLIEAILTLPGFSGVLAYDLAEAIWLSEHGVADILVGYPTVNRTAIAALIANPTALQQVTILVDAIEQLDLVDAVASADKRDDIRVAIDLDASLRLPVMGDLGVLRSPVHTVHQAVSLARTIHERRGFRLVGVMSYEAQVAGLGNESRAIQLMQSASMRELRDRRRHVIAEIRKIADLEFVNAGGTGSLEATAADQSVTDIAAGSGFFGGHLFDHYRHFRPAPALGFGLNVVRKPRPDVVTCHGGGWIASGPPGDDRLPQIAWPSGLNNVGREGAGEVQTPLRGDAARALGIGDRVWFRHTKSGELSEHVNTIFVVDGDTVVDEVPTYRGEGKAFL
ncbi:amino acid deaminase/aldolase [Smaragdicoccus niigatensis]|uniref:amino acid deaminase/aldolase n=1 Tax=Smaragdicoccus niigatensis TaxID=359359 RepID=UPI000371C75E|nr:amino acid deaminase/aldolase [Smaragdicoccus niigatensis]